MDDELDLPLVWGAPPPPHANRSVSPVQRRLQWYATQAKAHPGETLRIDPDKVFGGPITSNRAQYWRAHPIFAGFKVQSAKGVLYITFGDVASTNGHKPVKAAPAPKKVAAKKATPKPLRKVRPSAQGKAQAAG